MICTSREAFGKQCCAMNKPCEGEFCMAWRTYYVPNEKEYLPDFVDSGKGCCGLVYKADECFDKVDECFD